MSTAGSIPPSSLAPWLWHGKDLERDKRSWTWSLTDEEQDAVRRAGRRWEATDPPRPEVAAFADDERAVLAPCLDRVTRALRDGPGLCLLRGLPIDAVEEEGLSAVLRGLGSLLGEPVPQTKAGELVRAVSDKGRDYSAATVRGHDTNAELRYHCDRTDVIGLLCVRPASTGGRNLVVSAPAAYEALRQSDPDLLQALSEPLPHDRRGEQGPDESPWTMMPIFAERQGHFVARYIRRFIEDAGRHPDAPALSDRQRRALDALDKVLDEPGMALGMDLRQGDLQLLNNHVVFHARTAFEDDDGPGRLLLRLWLAPSWSPPLPAALKPLYGSVEAGAVRGGVRPAS